ncbi:hybrid sensor histidine kinase/response regulator [Vibrio viridaestus]|nr:hybrid sensor histidine kinase/response regulator [Vibrio viridaestus]
MNRTSLKQKTLMVLVIYSFVFITVIGVLAYQIIRVPLGEELRQNLDTRAELLSTKISEPLDSALSILRAISSVGETDLSQSQQEVMLKNLFGSIDGEVVSGGLWPVPEEISGDKQYNSMFFNRSVDGQVDQIFSWNNKQNGGYDKEIWYTSVVDKPKTTVSWSPVYIDTYTHVQMITASAPYYINGSFAGVATVDLSLNRLVEFITKHAERTGLGVSLKDQDGNIITSHNFRVRDGSYISSETFGKFDWYIQIVNADRLVSDEIFGIVTEIELWLIPLLFGGMLLGYYFISHHVISPIVSLSQKVQESKQGGLIDLPFRGKDELRYLVEAFNEKTIYLEEEKLKAQASTEAKSAFLATLSHEIRTPMNGILGNAQILLKSNLNNQQTQQLKQLYDSGQHMMTLLNEILDFSKIEKGQFRLDIHLFSFSQIQSAVENIYRNLCKEKGLSLTITSDIAEEQCYESDISRIKQVVFNLMSNAVKFTHQGSIQVHFSERETQGDIFLYISVSDSGIGVPKNAQGLIFEPFQQAESSTTRRFGGTGLGLSIVKSICDLMDGNITLTSEVDKGTTFEVLLKVNKPAKLEKPSLKSELQELPDCHHLCALIVEDNRTNAIILKTFLSSMGFTCLTAANGLEAMSELKQTRIDLVMMDNHMPVMDGIVCIRAIRDSRESFKDVLIIGCTADIQEDAKKDMIAAGGDDIIFKPVEEAQLKSLLIKHKERLFRYDALSEELQSMESLLVGFCMAVENKDVRAALTHANSIRDLLESFDDIPSETMDIVENFIQMLSREQLPDKDRMDQFTVLLSQFCL